MVDKHVPYILAEVRENTDPGRRWDVRLTIIDNTGTYIKIIDDLSRDSADEVAYSLNGNFPLDAL
jgi:hypothetical protein